VDVTGIFIVNFISTRRIPLVSLPIPFLLNLIYYFRPIQVYNELDARIAKSKAKKEKLLTVLNHPEIPLHNNRSENGARVQKRREDVSLQTKTKAGTKAKDTMMTIIETAKKHSISSYKYIYDRISNTYKMPSLANLIRVKSASQPIIYNSG